MSKYGFERKRNVSNSLTVRDETALKINTDDDSIAVSIRTYLVFF